MGVQRPVLGHRRSKCFLQQDQNRSQLHKRCRGVLDAVSACKECFCSLQSGRNRPQWHTSCR